MDDARSLLARATLWNWAARALAYPDPEFLAALSDPDARLDLEDVAGVVGDAALAAVRGIWTSADAEALELAAEHTYLFTRQVPVSPYETGYPNRGGPAELQTMAEVGGFYAAFGLQVSTERPERPDHVSMELTFVAALLAKEVYAREQDWAEQAAVTRDARDTFVAAHLASWFPAFVERLQQRQRQAFYPAVAALVQALLAAEHPAVSGPPNRPVSAWAAPR